MIVQAASLSLVYRKVLLIENSPIVNRNITASESRFMSSVVRGSRRRGGIEGVFHMHD